jgi:hypothetical protein
LTEPHRHRLSRQTTRARNLKRPPQSHPLIATRVVGVQAPRSRWLDWLLPQLHQSAAAAISTHLNQKNARNNDLPILGADGVRPVGGIRTNNDTLIVGSDGVHPLKGIHLVDGVRPNNDPPIVGADGVRPLPIDAGNLAPLRRKSRSLSSFVAGFKSAVTSRAGRELNMSGIWQRNYYDHIIRDDQDYMNIWDYIDTNPQTWQEDQLHPPVMIPSS